MRVVGASGGGGRERKGGNQGGEATCEGVHVLFSLRFLIVKERLLAATGASCVYRGR